MSAHFKLNYSGLNYLISSPDSCQDRNFLFNLLCHCSYSSTSLSSLQLISNMDRKELTKTLYRLLKKGWLSSSEQINESKVHIEEYDFSSYLPDLSSTGSVILADMSGLIVSSAGFPEDKIAYLAASATSLLKINEAAKSRNLELCNGAPWTLNLTWGDLNVMIQPIAIGSVQFALIVGGCPQFNNQSFYQLIAILARRYIK